MQALKQAIKSVPRLNRLARDVQTTFLSGSLEPELRLLPFLVAPHRAAVDVGANVGIYTHVLCKLASSVFSIEANPALAKELERTFGQTAKIINAAASDEEGVAELRIPMAGAISGGLATISSHNALNGSAFSTVTVPARRLSDMAPPDADIGFIKIDVEGHELAVLTGGRELIKRCRPTILLEAEERHRAGAVASINAFMAELGYEGLMLHDGILTSIRSFSVENHQFVSPQQSKRLDHGVRPKGYVNNFIYVPVH